MSDEDIQGQSAPKRTTKAAPKVKPIKLGIYKMANDAHDPMWATNGSACFDLKAYLKPGKQVMLYTEDNVKQVLVARAETSRDNSGILLNPNSRALIPTGLIINIPDYHSLRVHPRSGLSWKEGITLTNCEGVIDYDYVDQLFISVVNISRQRVFIGDGERIAQAELVEGIHADGVEIISLTTPPLRKTTRAGGFGHSGKK